MATAWFLLAVCLVPPGWKSCPSVVEGGQYFYATEAECVADIPVKIHSDAKAGIMCVKGVIMEPSK